MKRIKMLNNRIGMTYVELLVALSLLMLIIMSFTPMLLSSYNHVYTAGERNEEVYDAKTGVEHSLALRNGTNIKRLKTTIGSVAEAFAVDLRQAVTDVNINISNKLESLFSRGNAKIEIISGSHINDDTVNKKIVLKITGIDFSRVNINGDPKKEYTGVDDEGTPIATYQIGLSVYYPDFEKNSVEKGSSTYIYQNSCQVTQTSINTTTGLVTFEVEDKDCTESPLRIEVTYYDENTVMTKEEKGGTVADGQSPRTAVAYLHIESPSIIIAGETNSTYKYYTTAGLNETKRQAADGSYSYTYSLDVQGRKMKTNNSIPSTTIKSVSFITNDPTQGLDKYYVLTGTNGAILRMYDFTSSAKFEELKSILNGNNYKVVALNDNGVRFNIMKTLWGGDYTHQFGYTTYEKSVGYGVASSTDLSGEDNDGGESKWCWYTEKRGYTSEESLETIVSSTNGTGQDPVYGLQAKYAYYFNGFRTDFDYDYQNNRKISYCLTEKGYSVRYVGNLLKSDRFVGYNSIWEANAQPHTSVSFAIASWYKGNKKYNWTDVNPGYLYNSSNTYPVYWITDDHLGYVYIKSMNNFDNSSTTSSGIFYTSGTASKSSDLDKSGATASVNVTTSFFDEASGKMFYLGTVRAYCLLEQVDATDNTSNAYQTVRNNGYYHNTSYTGYYLQSNEDCTYTTINKYSETGCDWGNIVNSLKNKTSVASSTVTSYADNARFYYERKTSGESYNFSDVLFTFGFSSNRENVYANITYNGVNEYYKSYEPYYFLSHYGSNFKVRNLTVNGVTNTYKTSKSEHSLNYYSNSKSYTGTSTTSTSYLNSCDNDYYNIWFPGEMYNLTKSAHKDGITVAVGYAMSGSTFQWINGSQTSNTSTAVGGFFNDGVLAAKRDTDESFTNLLYFKDNNTIATKDLSSKYACYSSTYGTYGTHSRRSIQFTAVDLMVCESGDTRYWYAYYGDNTGRVFKSTVASTTKTSSGATTYGTLNLADKIKDSNVTGGMSPLYVNGQTVDKIFKKITSISVEGTTLIITGEPVKSSDGLKVIYVDEVSTDVWRSTVVQLSTKAYTPNCSTISDGVYYVAGEKSGSGGFVAALNLSKLTDIINKNANGKTYYYLPYSETYKNNGLYCVADNISAKMYGIAAKGD